MFVTVHLDEIRETGFLHFSIFINYVFISSERWEKVLSAFLRLFKYLPLDGSLKIAISLPENLPATISVHHTEDIINIIKMNCIYCKF